MTPAPALKRARAKALPRQHVELDRNVPKHVRHCYETGARDWWIYVWKKENPAVKTRIPYQCQSWRCPTCQRHESHVLFARIKEAFAGLDPRGFCFLVMTLDREGYYSGKPWADAATAFAQLSTMSRNFLKRLWRWVAVEYGEETWRTTPTGKRRRAWVYHDQHPEHRARYTSRWVSTVEAHRSGWPHLNVIIHCPELADRLRAQEAQLADEGQHRLDRRLLQGELAGHAQDVGWGVMCTAEAARDAERAAGYAVKVAGKAEATAGEIAKLTQLPHEAPWRFRRLRSGRGFLPPRRKNPEVTGTLVRRILQPDGTFNVLPLHRPPAESLDQVVSVCYSEEHLCDEEHAAKHWNQTIGRRVPALRVCAPPVQSFAPSRGS